MTRTSTKKPIPTGEGLTFEKVWAAMQESSQKFDREMKESTQKFDREMKESSQRFDREMKEMRAENDRQRAENDRQMKEYNRRFGDFTRRFGEVVEYMIAPNLCKKFAEFEFVFQKSTSGTSFSDNNNDIHFEVDVMLENGEKAMLVEVKTKPLTEDVREHIVRLKKMRKYADLHGDKRTFLGAVAGVVMSKYVKSYVLKQGFFAIEPSGETFNITSPSNNPKEW
jgi:hypothetical protein